VIDDLFAGQDDFFRRQRRFAHDAEIAPDVGVAFAVGALHVDDRHVGTKGAHSDQILVRERAAQAAKLFRAGKIAPHDRSCRKKRHSRGSGLQRQAHGEVGVFLDFNRPGNPRFRGAPVVMAETGGDIPDPRGDDLSDAAGADHLIELHVRYRSDQSEVLLLLADDLVACRERDQRFERAAGGDRHAVLNVGGDRLAQ
jgi:hypothetical protein